MESSRVESTLPYLPAEVLLFLSVMQYILTDLIQLLYAIHITARNASLPVTSKHLYLTFKNAPSSVKARYLLGLADKYMAMELVTTHLTKILTYPICTQNVLQRYLGLLVPYYHVDPLDTQLPETQITSEKLALQPGIQAVFSLPKRLFRNIVADSDTAAQTTEFVEYLCSVPPVYRHLSRNVITDIRKIEPFTPRPNVDSHGGYPLIRAVQSKHIPLVRLLLNYGADPTKREGLAIFTAIKLGDLELVRLLIDTAEVRATEQMLSVAVKSNASDVVEWLVKAKGCIPDMKTLRLMG